MNVFRANWKAALSFYLGGSFLILAVGFGFWGFRGHGAEKGDPFYETEQKRKMYIGFFIIFTLLFIMWGGHLFFTLKDGGMEDPFLTVYNFFTQIFRSAFSRDPDPRIAPKGLREAVVQDDGNI